MSVDSISSSSNWWQWRSQVEQSSSNSTGNTASSGSSGNTDITNSGTVTSNNLSAFMAAFSADLQSMLAQASSSSDTTATSSASTANSADQSATSESSTDQQSAAVHHHHHHAHGSGEGASTQGTADQLVNEIGQSLQSGTLTTDQINQSASLLATDVMQAIQSYGTTTPTATTTGSIVV